VLAPEHTTLTYPVTVASPTGKHWAVTKYHAVPAAVVHAVSAYSLYVNVPMAPVVGTWLCVPSTYLTYAPGASALLVVSIWMHFDVYVGAAMALASTAAVAVAHALALV